MIPFLALDMVNIFFSPFSGFLDMFLLLRSFSLDNIKMKMKVRYIVVRIVNYYDTIVYF